MSELVIEPIYEFKVIIIEHDGTELEDLLAEGWRIDSGWQNPNGSLFVLMRVGPGTEIDGVKHE